MPVKTFENVKAELIKVDTALRSFRDGGYTLADAVGEIVDNAVQSGATDIRIDWHVKETPIPRSKKVKREVEWFAIADNGSGIPPAILAHVLTVGFSTRYGSREGIGRFGVGFKLASISQAKRMEIYTRPAYLEAKRTPKKEDRDVWTFSEENAEGRVFRTHLDLDEIDDGAMEFYSAKEVEGFPEECAHLVSDETCTLIVWRKTDRLNLEPSFAEKVDEKLKSLAYFLRRTYRVYISNGINIYLHGDEEPLHPYDPLFEIDNPEATALAKGQPMKGEFVDAGTIKVDGEEVRWMVQLTPPVTRLLRGGGGEEGPDGPRQFEDLHIPDNEGKISFLRHNREISYTVVPRMFPSRVRESDRYIGIQVSFPPALDEYFEVKHIKRGAEPMMKLRDELRRALDKPIRAARNRTQDLWEKMRKEQPTNPEDTSGDRNNAENVAKASNAGLPSGKAGLTMPPEEEDKRLRQAAVDLGITEEAKQNAFIEHAKQQPVVSVDVEWSNNSMFQLEHLTNTVLVRINRRHPFIEKAYLPLRDVLKTGVEGMHPQQIVSLLEAAADGIDLLFFAYAKAENMSQKPNEDFGLLRDFWGTFAAVYLRDRSKQPTN